MNRNFKRASLVLAASVLSLNLFAIASANAGDGVVVTAPRTHEAHAQASEQLALKHERMANALKAAQAGTRAPGNRGEIFHNEKLAKTYRDEAGQHRQMAANAN